MINRVIPKRIRRFLMFWKSIKVIALVLLLSAFIVGACTISAKTNPVQPVEVVEEVAKEEETKRIMAEFIKYRNPRVFNALAEGIVSTIYRYTEGNPIEPEFVLTIMMVESNFNINAISKKGAIGLMQINPYVWINKDYEYSLDNAGIVNETRELFNPYTNIIAGIWILNVYHAECSFYDDQGKLNKRGFKSVEECVAKKYIGISNKKTKTPQKYYIKLRRSGKMYANFLERS
jgi:soluble lytic murein transglycosylase-like protein